MKLKMPGPNGIITLASDLDIAVRAENKTAAVALEALCKALAAEELTALCSTVDRDMPRQTTQIHLLQTGRRNSQIPSPSNGPQEDSIYWSTTRPNGSRRAMRVPTRELGYIRLAPF